MSDITTLRSYLVGLGFDVDMKEFRNFERSLKEAASVVTGETGKIAGDLLKWQAGIVGMFAAISGAVVGAIDKVSMADQEYRLLGESMFMTTANARSLKVSMDALGAPLEAIAFDPELHQRFLQLQQDQQNMMGGVGGDFEANMKKVRDIRFEFTRLKVELQYLTMGAVNSIFKDLGLGSGDLLKNLQNLNQWIISNIPKLSDEFAHDLVPILKDTWELFKDIGHAIEEFGVMFTNVVGLFSGDHSIEGATFNFQKFGTAVEHVVGGLDEFVQIVTNAEEAAVHLASAMALLMSGNFTGAKQELGGFDAAMRRDPTTPAGQKQIVNPYTTLGRDMGLESYGSVASHWKDMVMHGAVDSQLASTAKQFGLPTELVQAVANQESGGRQYDQNGEVLTSDKGALGIMQIMPNVAQQYGVDAANPEQNIQGGVKLLADMLKHFKGSEWKALAAYNWGQGNVDNALKRGLGLSSFPKETQQYVNSIERYQRASSFGPGVGPGAGQSPSHNTTVGDINVNVLGETKASIMAAVRQQQAIQNQRLLAELTSVYG